MMIHTENSNFLTYSFSNSLKKLGLVFLATILFFLGCSDAPATNFLQDTVAQDQKTKQTEQQRSRAEVALQSAYEKNLQKFESRKNYLIQNQLISDIKKEIKTLKTVLANHPNFTLIKEDIRDFTDILPEVLTGINDEYSETVSERNLTVTSTILEEILQKLENYQLQVSKYAIGMRELHYRIDSISAQPALFQIPLDTLEAAQYTNDVREITVDTKPVEDSLFV